MPVIARVIVVDGDVGAARDWCARLERLGYGAEAATPAALPLLTGFDLALLADGDPAVMAQLQPLPILVAGDVIPTGAAAILDSGCSDAALQARLDALSRLDTMRREIRRRGAVTEGYGGEAARLPRAPVHVDDARILLYSPTAGEAALLVSAGEVVDIDDRFALLDQLQSRPVDAAILAGPETDTELFDLVEDIRRNPRLFHLPLIALRDRLPDEPAAYARGLTDLWRQPLNLPRAASHLDTLIRQYRHRLALMRTARESRHPATVDALTGHYTFGFFMANLGAQIRDARAENRQLSLLVLDVLAMRDLNRAHGHIGGDRLLRQIASLLGGLVRGEDVVARLPGAAFAVVLPDTAPDVARRVLGRLDSIVEHTEFALPGRDDAVYLGLKLGLAAVGPGDDAEIMLARALADMR